MRTLRTILLASVSSAPFNATAQIPNGGFEGTMVIGDDTIPDGWSVNSGFGGGSVQDGHTGDRSLGVWHWYYYGIGVAANGQTAMEGYEGSPFTGTPAGLSGYFKRVTGSLVEEQSGNDSGLVVMMLTRWNPDQFGRDTVAFGQRAFGEQPQWTWFELDLDYQLGGDPDTMVVRVLSGIDCFCGAGTDGTCCYLYLDELALDMQNGVSMPLFDQPGARVLGIGDGRIEVRIADALHVPMTLRLHDSSGRLTMEHRISSDREDVTVPTRQGLFFYSLTRGAEQIARGKVLVY